MRIDERRRGARRWWPGVSWLLLALFGCGAGLQAEDAETVALVQRARELYDGGQTAAAREKIELAVRRSPDNPQALYLRGLCQLRLKEFAKAREDLAKARQIDPLTMFAPSREEFETAWRTARENAPSGETGELTTPAATDKAKPEASTTTPPKPRPVSQEPAVQALAAEGAVVADLSGQELLTSAQRLSLDKATANLARRNVRLKLIVLPAGTDARAEAARLYQEAGLEPDTLLVVGVPPDKVAAYTAALTPEEIKPAVNDALQTAAPDASLARRMILVATGLGPRLQPLPEVPETIPPPPLEAPDTAPVPEPPPLPTEPEPPTGGLSRPLLLAYGGGGLLLGALLWMGLARLLARRRLGLGFGRARPQVEAIAGRLGQVMEALLRKTDRRAEAAHNAAELAYFEALAMMAEATEDDTGDIARVERALRLLDEAGARLTEAEARLSEAADRPAGPIYHCYFTGRPLLNRWDGDLVALKRGDRERLVMVARAVGDRIRRGEVPPVRAVRTPRGLVHWSRAEGYTATRDLYLDRVAGQVLVSPRELAEPLFEETEPRVFPPLSDRPDYRLDLD